jgi:protein-S-isoprenylcysteine O-methyltransferase Ste14
MQSQGWQLVVLAASWIGYFAIHSLLASLSAKSWIATHFPTALPAYRLAFNFVAVALLIPPLWLALGNPGPKIWVWSGALAWLANAMALTAVALFIWSLRYYDSGEFFGIRQWKEREQRVEDQERLRISPLHRIVRHPWYSLGLVLIWTRDLDASLLLSNLLITAYFVIGSRLEERKLIQYHGERYRLYRERVPALLPSPWRRLSTEEAESILARDRESTAPGNLNGKDSRGL